MGNYLVKMELSIFVPDMHKGLDEELVLILLLVLVLALELELELELGLVHVHV